MFYIFAIYVDKADENFTIKDMRTSFYSIANRSGIVCASNQDHTLYSLSKEEPLAVAVDPKAPIPWDGIIDGYKRLGEPEYHSEFSDYAKDFERYLSSQSHLSGINLGEGTKVIFFGYGTEDIFPRIYSADVKQNDEGVLEFCNECYEKISVNNKISLCHIGEFESIETLLYGTTHSADMCILENHTKMYNAFVERVLDKFKGTKYEAALKEHIAAFDKQAMMQECIDRATYKQYCHAVIGIDSFSIEDMVDAAETIVDANANLDHLRSGCKEPLTSTRELAVVTRIEGLTWIKHSLFTF